MDAADDGTTVDRSADGEGRESGREERGREERCREERGREVRGREERGLEAVERYYASIDAHDYERLASLLAPTFVHYRPDRTLDGRETFVRFMREDRPMTETTHEIDAIYPNGHGVAAQGRLLDAAGEELFAFVDVFSVDDDGRLETLYTYTS